MSKSEDPAWKICLGSASEKECGMKYMLLGDIRNDVNSSLVLISVWTEARDKRDPNLYYNMALSTGDLVFV